AHERKAIVDVSNYDETLDLTSGEDTFRNITDVYFTPKHGASTFIDALIRTAHSEHLTGADHDPSVADVVSTRIDNLAADNVLTVVADAEYTNTGEGLHRFVVPVDGEVYLYSQFEVPDSRRVFAVFEQPDLKATFTFT